MDFSNSDFRFGFLIFFYPMYIFFIKKVGTRTGNHPISEIPGSGHTNSVFVINGLSNRVIPVLFDPVHPFISLKL